MRSTWIFSQIPLGRNQVNLLRQFPNQKGVFAIRRLDAYHADTVTLKPLWSSYATPPQFPILHSWNPYSKSHHPFLSYAITPQDDHLSIMYHNVISHKIQIGDWWFFAKFPTSWQPDIRDADLICLPPFIEKIDRFVSENQNQNQHPLK